MREIGVVIDETAYLVRFEVEHFSGETEIEGKYRKLQVRATTLCEIIEAKDGAVWSGQATCSVRDAYDHLKGCRISLDRAVRALYGYPVRIRDAQASRIR